MVYPMSLHFFLVISAQVPAVFSCLYLVLLGHVFPFAERDSSSLSLNASQPDQNPVALSRERRSLGELGVLHLVIVGKHLWVVQICV